MKMADKSVFNTIKKQNGEAFAQGIRVYDNGLFEIPDLAKIVKYAGRNSTPLLKFLESLKSVKISEVDVQKSPFDLLKEAGYTAFWADDYEKQTAIRPYFSFHEELCTFCDQTKFERYFIIHCVKEGAEKLKRADFTHPMRDDAYALSVISIQILKEGGFIKIVNRYNNSDNTFNSNPDNIIEGLSSALKQYFQVDFSSKQENMPTGFVYQNGRIYKIHQETKGVCFGDSFYLKNGELFLLNPDNQLVINDFVIDLKEKKVFSPVEQDNNLMELIEDEIKGKTLRISKAGNTKSLYANGQLILKETNNHLTHLYLPTTEKEAVNLFCLDDKIEEFESARITSFKESCFYFCPALRKIRILKLKESPDEFVMRCPKLEEVDMPSLEIMGKNNFVSLDFVPALTFFSLKKTGAFCFVDLRNLTHLSAPILEEMGANSMRKCLSLNKISFPSLMKIDSGCFYSCPKAVEFNLNNLIETGDFCFAGLQKAESFSLNALQKIGSACFVDIGATHLILKSLTTCLDDGFRQNKFLQVLQLPSLQKTGEGFLTKNPQLRAIDISSLQVIERESFSSNKKLAIVKADALEKIHPYSGIKETPQLEMLYAPKLNPLLVFVCFSHHENVEKISTHLSIKSGALLSNFNGLQHE